MRERPRLAGDVARPRNLDADFLGHLPGEALLERLARLDEAGERAVHAGREVRAARKQDLAAAANERHDRRGHPGIGRKLADRTDAHALLAVRLGATAAAAAELVVAVPVDELKRPAGEGEVRVVEYGEERAQPFEGHPLRRRGVLGDLRRPTLLSLENT